VKIGKDVDERRDATGQRQPGEHYLIGKRSLSVVSWALERSEWRVQRTGRLRYPTTYAAVASLGLGTTIVFTRNPGARLLIRCLRTPCMNLIGCATLRQAQSARPHSSYASACISWYGTRPRATFVYKPVSARFRIGQWRRMAPPVVSRCAQCPIGTPSSLDA
jgi:hypothetical protein